MRQLVVVPKTGKTVAKRNPQEIPAGGAAGQPESGILRVTSSPLASGVVTVSGMVSFCRSPVSAARLAKLTKPVQLSVFVTQS